jgi:hypothetical protein
LYVSLVETMVCVLGDQPFRAKLDQEIWDKIHGTIVEGIRGGRPAQAFSVKPLRTAVSSGKGSGSATHALEDDSSTTQGSQRSFSIKYEKRSTLQGLGNSFKRTGFVSTRS